MAKTNQSLIGRIFGNIFLLLNILAVAWMGLCTLAAFVSPQQIPYLAIFSLTTPFAIAANVFFVLFWLFSSHKLRVLYSALTLVACYKVSLTVFGLNFFGDNDMSERHNTIKIMSWNSHGMGIHNRPRDKAADRRLLEFIEQTDADILCMMEYPTPRNDFMNKVTTKIIKDNRYKDFRFKDDNVLSKIIFLGTAVFSRYPLKNFVAHKLSEYIYMLQADVDIPGGGRVRMFIVHLNTFGLSDHEKAYIEDVKNNARITESNIDSSKTFIPKLAAGFSRRSKETDIAAKVIAQSPYPVLICGDMNDVPGSYTYTRLRGDLKDVFLEKGVGLGRTYNQIFPTIRIDHMFYDPAILKLIGFQCPKTDLSDHNPLVTNFEIIPVPRN